MLYNARRVCLQVILVTNLDRERIARYQISVRCNDFGFPQLENSKNFEVIIHNSGPTLSACPSVCL